MQDGGDEQARPGAKRFGRVTAKPSDEAVGETIELDAPTVAGASDQAATEPSGQAPAPPKPAAAEQPGQAASSPASAATEQSTAAGDESDATADATTIEAEVRMSDGAVYMGTINVTEGERALDVVNSPVPFFELVETSGKVRLLSKSQVLQIMPYEKGTAAGRGGGSLM